MTRLDKARQAYREAKAALTKAGEVAANYQRALTEAENLRNDAEGKVWATKKEVLDALAAEDTPA